MGNSGMSMRKSTIGLFLLLLCLPRISRATVAEYDQSLTVPDVADVCTDCDNAVPVDTLVPSDTASCIDCDQDGSVDPAVEDNAAVGDDGDDGDDGDAVLDSTPPSLTAWSGTSVIYVTITAVTPSGKNTYTTIAVFSITIDMNQTNASNFVNSVSGAGAFALSQFMADYPNWSNAQVYTTANGTGSESPQVVAVPIIGAAPALFQTRSIGIVPAPVIGTPP